MVFIYLNTLLLNKETVLITDDNENNVNLCTVKIAPEQSLNKKIFGNIKDSIIFIDKINNNNKHLISDIKKICTVYEISLVGFSLS